MTHNIPYFCSRRHDMYHGDSISLHMLWNSLLEELYTSNQGWKRILYPTYPLLLRNLKGEEKFVTFIFFVSKNPTSENVEGAWYEEGPSLEI